MSTFIGRIKVSGSGSDESGSGQGPLGSYLVRDTNQFTDGQTILSWVTSITACTEKSIYENIPSDAPNSEFTGIISAKILSPENKIREVIAYGTSIDEIYYRIAISGATSTWLTPWRNIVADATTLEGLSADDIFNKEKTLQDYISFAGVDTDLRLLIGINKVPSGEYILDMSTAFAKRLTGVPATSGVLHITIARSNYNSEYYASVFMATEDITPDAYFCVIYGTSRYTNWCGAGSGAASGISDTLGISTRLSISSTSDFNQITEDGAYYVGNDAVMMTLYHRPCDKCGYLNVRHVSPTNLIQEYVTSDFRIWSRHYTNGSWSDWVYVYNSSDDLTKDAPNGVHIGPTHPEFATQLWVDTAHNAAIKYYDDNTGSWLPCALAWS